jgi:hypothetical protein
VPGQSDISDFPQTETNADNAVETRHSSRRSVLGVSGVLLVCSSTKMKNLILKAKRPRAILHFGACIASSYTIQGLIGICYVRLRTDGGTLDQYRIGISYPYIGQYLGAMMLSYWRRLKAGRALRRIFTKEI